MTKIMLVEDDKSLREIYGVRLLAEGYDIVSAGDGEEALAMAIKERPQLIVSDVMMPKVSGYDMLDILRSTTETKNIRVIMMTALSSEEQRMRAESLGADRYLVKSQVGIEDVVRVVHEVLEDTPATMAAAASTQQTPPPQAAPAPAPVSTPLPVPAATPPVLASPQSSPVQQPVPTPPQPLAAPAPTLPPPASASLPPKPLGSAPKPASLKSRIIQPLHDPTISPVNINDLLDKELAKEAGIADTDRPAVVTVDQEKAAIAQQLQSFVPPEPTPVDMPTSPQQPPATPSGPSLLPVPGLGNSDAIAPPAAIPPPPATPPAPAVLPTPPSAPQTAPQPPSPPSMPPAPAIPATMPAVPTATLTPSTEPVVDLTKLPEVPRV